MIRGLMTDEEWAIFAPFLITASSRGGRPPLNHRHRLDGILWICRTGAPWRDLPAAFGRWNSVWKQSAARCESGIWDLLLQALADGGGTLDMLQMIDSTIVRAHRCAAGEKTEEQNQALGRSRGGFSTKIHVRCNAAGLPIGVASISEGEAHDVTAYDGLMQQRDSDPGAMLADKGYDSDAIRHDLRDSGATPEIASRSNRKGMGILDQQTLSMRCGHGLSASLGISRSSAASPPDMTSSPPASWDSSCSDASASGRGLSTGPSDQCRDALSANCSGRSCVAGGVRWNHERSPNRSHGTGAKLGVRRQQRLAGMSRWLDGISVRIRH